VFLSGISIFLSTKTVGRLFDDFEFDWLLVAVEAIVAGLLVAIQNFWVLGGAVFLGSRAADSAASYRQARHVTGLATAPFALALFLVWPVRLAMFGADAFRSGGSDHGAAEAVFRTIDVGCSLVRRAHPDRRPNAERLEPGRSLAGSPSPGPSSSCSCCCSSCSEDGRRARLRDPLDQRRQRAGDRDRLVERDALDHRP
jgi:hypothetical protein